MSTIEVNKITPVSGGTTVQVGESGDTINIPANATIANAGTATGFLPNNLTFTGGILTTQTDANEQDAILIKQSDGTDVGSLRLNNGSFLLKGKNSSSPVQIQTHDGNEDIEVDPDGFIKFETAGVEAMRIDSGQRLSFGKDAVSTPRLHYPNNDPQFVTKVGSTSSRTAFLFNNPNGTVGDIATSGSSTSYNTSSDYRLKENVSDISDGIDRVKQLQPKRFNFIADETNTLVDGFIAHEVSNVVPEAITGTKDGMAKIYYQEDDEIPNGKQVGEFKEYSTTEIQPQAIDQAKLVPLLTKALQEAITKIETLEAKVTALESA